MNNNICVICLETMICKTYNCNNCNNDFAVVVFPVPANADILYIPFSLCGNVSNICFWYLLCFI